MKKNSKSQLAIIIALLSCAIALFGAAIAVACSDRNNSKDSQNSIVTSEDDAEWTSNY